MQSFEWNALYTCTICREYCQGNPSCEMQQLLRNTTAEREQGGPATCLLANIYIFTIFIIIIWGICISHQTYTFLTTSSNLIFFLKKSICILTFLNQWPQFPHACHSSPSPQGADWPAGIYFHSPWAPADFVSSLLKQRCFPKTRFLFTFNQGNYLYSCLNKAPRGNQHSWNFCKQ